MWSDDKKEVKTVFTYVTSHSMQDQMFLLNLKKNHLLGLTEAYRTSNWASLSSTVVLKTQYLFIFSLWMRPWLPRRGDTITTFM